MTVIEILDREFSSGGIFLALGRTLDVQSHLVQKGWSGVAVSDWDQDHITAPNLTVVRGLIGTSQRLARTMEGHYESVITLDELFFQFSSPYQVIAIENTGIDRWLWHERLIQDCLPKIYILPEDGHNESVVELSSFRGYRNEVVEERLVLIHP